MWTQAERAQHRQVRTVKACTLYSNGSKEEEGGGADETKTSFQ
jgi:hypothetical protein